MRICEATLLRSLTERQRVEVVSEKFARGRRTWAPQHFLSPRFRRPGASFSRFDKKSGKFPVVFQPIDMDNQQFTVLLVEDDLNDIFLVKRAFRTARIPNPLQVVTDGEEAISYLSGEGKYADRQAHPLPNLIVMDIKMPRRSGFEVLEWVKGDGRPLRRIPVIIVSSSDDPAGINRAYELGANAYMIKPMNYRAVERLFDEGWRLFEVIRVYRQFGTAQAIAMVYNLFWRGAAPAT